MQRVPVLLVGVDCLSGVTTWAEEVRAAMAGHPRYDVQLLGIGPEAVGKFDICVPTVEAARDEVCKLAPVILFPNYMWEVFLAGLERGVFCVGMCHADSDEQYYRPLSWYEPAISHFIAVSRECSKSLSERLPYRASEITTLPYGVTIPPVLERRYQNRPLRLIYAGRVTQPQKRVFDFIPLIENLLKANVNFQFNIVGAGDAYSALKDETHDRFPAGLVRFHPRVPHEQMRQIWLEHDVFLQVSEFEGTSVSMLEAMAHGVVPAVTAATSGIEGVIHAGQNGFVVPIGDMQAMADAIATLAADDGRLSPLGAAARQTSLAYSIDAYRDRFAEVLDQVLHAGQKVDMEKRYGMFAGCHPILRMHQQIVRQREELADLRRSAVRRIIDGGYRKLVPSQGRHASKRAN